MKRLTIDDVRLMAERLARKHNMLLNAVVDLSASDKVNLPVVFEVRMQTLQKDFFGAIRLDEEDLDSKDRTMHYLEQLCESVRNGAWLQDRKRRGKLKLELATRSADMWWYHIDTASLIRCEVGMQLDGREILAVDTARKMIALPPLMEVVLTKPKAEAG